MATYYLPDENGWSGSGSGGSAAVRFRIEQSYSAASNKSSLTVRLQAKLDQNQYQRVYELQAGSVRIGSGSAEDLAGRGYTVALSDYGVWHSVQADGADKTWSYEVSHNADGSASVPFALTGLNLYKYIGGDERNIRFEGEKAASLSLSETRTFTLTISAGTGSTVTVTRNGAALSNGAAISYGEVLTVAFAAAAGYTLTAHTINGASFPSGGTHTVTGAVSAAATAARKTYALTISAGEGSAVTVTRNGAALSNGATLTHGDVLTVTFAAQSGYELTAHTVNGASFPSGGTHTVTGAVSAAATARRLGLLRLDTGSGIRRCRVLLDTGAALVPVRIFIDRGDRIEEAGI